MLPQPAFLMQRQQNFHFQQHDPIVQYFLDPADIASITHWQAHGGYTFEFHEMHDIGNPIYIRPDGNTAKSSMTKIDTKNIANPALHYLDNKNKAKPWIQNIANFAVISKIGQAQIDEIASIMTHEWKFIQKLADRRWSGWKKTAPPKTLMERALESGQYPPPPIR
jgi:hypothetical protein